MANDQLSMEHQNINKKIHFRCTQQVQLPSSICSQSFGSKDPQLNWRGSGRAMHSSSWFEKLVKRNTSSTKSRNPL